VPKALKIVAALMVAVASAAIGWFGVKWWQDSQTSADPGPSLSPSPTTSEIAYVTLTFDADALRAEASAIIPRPVCGEEWVGTAASANGVTLSATAGLEDVDGNDQLVISAGFGLEGDDPIAFVSAEADYIVTRNGVVVSPDWGAEYVPAYFVAATSSETPAGASVSLSGPTLCDVADELAAIWADVDFETATAEDIAAAQALSDAFNAQNASLPSGEYKIYAVAPVTLGETAAIARALSDEGVANIGTLSYSIGNSPLGADERIVPYCTDETDANGDVVVRNCDVPADVLLEVLTRDVPAAYVVEGDTALAVSEPVTIVVE
jgi:hypothetical protein